MATKKTKKKVTKKTSKKKGIVLISSITKAEATELYQAFGFKSAVNWTAGKMQKKLRNLDKMIEGIELTPAMQKHVNTILQSQAAGKTIEVIGRAEAAADKKAQKEVDDAAKREVERKAEKKSKDKAKTQPKDKKTAKKSKKAESKDKKPTINSVTVELLRKNHLSIEQIIKGVSKVFPERADSLQRTMKGRIGKYLEEIEGVKLQQDDKGRFFIK